MLRKTTLLAMMLVLALGALAIAGCGGDDEKSSGSSTTQSTDSGGSGGGGGSKSDDSGGGGGGTDVSDNPQVKAAIEQCKTAIDQQPALKDDTKSELKDLCDKAASGDIKDVQKATVEVCKKIVEDTVPDSAGSAKDTALKQCDAAAP
jgi:hypothetical protein